MLLLESSQNKIKAIFVAFSLSKISCLLKSSTLSSATFSIISERIFKIKRIEDTSVDLVFQN